MIAVKMHMSNGEAILAACDHELLGLTFKEGRIRLHVSERFYNGEALPDEVLAERMRSASIMNLVGERTVAIAVSEGYVDEANVIVIDGVRHAQVVMG